MTAADRLDGCARLAAAAAALQRACSRAIAPIARRDIAAGAFDVVAPATRTLPHGHAL